MDWKDLLITLYFEVCKSFEAGLDSHTQRFSNDSTSLEISFTDQEAITIYLFGLIQNRRTVSEIHQYTNNHLKDWFPDLPSYQKLNERLNRLNNALAALNQSCSNRLLPCSGLNRKSI